MKAILHLKKRHFSFSPFSQRLFWSVFTMFLGFMICVTVFQFEREKKFSELKIHELLQNYNFQLHSKYTSTIKVDRMVEDFINDIPEKNLRVTIIDLKGTVIYDNTHQVKYDNHYMREELRYAREGVNSYAIRTSKTTGQHYFYSASYFGNFIFRCALPYNPKLIDALAINKNFIYFMLFILLIYMFILSRFTLSIGNTISKLREFALRLEKQQDPSSDFKFPNNELGDISNNIVTFYNLHQRVKHDLMVEREKIEKHFQYAREGFAMFSADGSEILSNILFIQFINTFADLSIYQTEEAINVKELAPIRDFIKKHLGKTNTRVWRHAVTIDKGGKIFLIECILFLDDSYELSINDISRQEEESRMKQQLTQNIAHELKTPVSSIQGYLETILTVKNLDPEKEKYFLNRCYSQSTRLADLLHDISVLNRLSEAGSLFELKETDICELIDDIERTCSPEMEKKHITFTKNLANHPIIKGNYSLLYSIFRNLMDNAIAYAGTGIQISVSCYKEDPNFYYFSFEDNGVGIPSKHVNRIFERFYRVDKGRSRKMGGTGLGLSIVKNAVKFHKGRISVKSELDKRTIFFFTLKKYISIKETKTEA